jgi:hypothetical protein
MSHPHGLLRGQLETDYFHFLMLALSEPKLTQRVHYLVVCAMHSIARVDACVTSGFSFIG